MSKLLDSGNGNPSAAEMDGKMGAFSWEDAPLSQMLWGSSTDDDLLLMSIHGSSSMPHEWL